MKISVLLIFLTFLPMFNLKTMQCMQILYIPNDCFSAGHVPFLVLGGVRALDTSGASVHVFWVWHV